LKTSDGLKIKRDWKKLLLFFAFYWLIRLPILPLGFGVDGDAWRIAKAGMRWIATGKYYMSRYPGYPLTELFAGISLVVDGAFLTNFLSALWGFLICIILWDIISEKTDSVKAFVSVIVLSIFPIFYSATTESMDYAPALFWSLLAFWMSRRKYPYWLSAISCGIAIEFRFTSILFMPILAFMTYKNEKKKKLLKTLIYISIATISGGAGYYRLIARFQSSIKTPAFIWEYSHIPYYIFVVFGFWFFIAAIFVIVKYKSNIFKIFKGEAEIVMLIVLFLMLFFKFPLDKGYLLPIIPFLLILFAKLDKKSWIILMCSLGLNSFFSVDVKGVKIPEEKIYFHPSIGEGELIKYVAKRKFQISTFEELKMWARHQKNRIALFIPSGINEPMLVPDDDFYQSFRDCSRCKVLKGTNVVFVGIPLPKKMILKYFKSYKIILLEGIVRDEYVAFNYDIINELERNRISYVYIPKNKISSFLRGN